MIQGELFQSIVVDAFREAETGGLLRVQDQPRLHSKYKADPGSFARAYLKIKVRKHMQLCGKAVDQYAQNLRFNPRTRRTEKYSFRLF